MHQEYLLHEFFFSSVIERCLKIGFYRLPTHRSKAHRKFLDDPFSFWRDFFEFLDKKFKIYDRYATNG